MRFTKKQIKALKVAVRATAYEMLRDGPKETAVQLLDRKAGPQAGPYKAGA